METEPLETQSRRPRLGDVLKSKGILTQDQLAVALTEQAKSPDAGPLGKIIIDLGFVTEAVMRDTLSQTLEQESIDLQHIVPDSKALAMLPKAVARQLKMLPVAFDEATQALSVATVDAFDVPRLDRLRTHLGAGIRVQTRLAGEVEIENAVDHFYGHELSVDAILEEIETGQYQVDTRLESEEYNHPVVRLVDGLLSDAVKRGASDIHFEPEEGFLRIRYRLDGVLRQIRCLHKSYWSAIAVRLKVMSGMNIAETRAPQDGRISLIISGRPIDFRVASQLTTHGENIVLRILDRQKGIVPLSQLGFTDTTQAQFEQLLQRPEGIVLITGPTGSGKTTTLYSLLDSMNSEAVNIMTLEDPVEYPMDMVRQTSINESIKMDFANGIRSIMRQDPDIILVGEIRDEETADMAFRAAMTGHQVYSTLHTNSAIGAIPRLLDIGVVPDILAGNIIGIVAQRLVRLLCPTCKQAYPADADEQTLLTEQATLYRAVGCDHCDQQGYRGRTAIAEVLLVDETLDELIAQRATMRELRQYVESQGMQTLRQAALEKVLTGQTSMDEVRRVVHLKPVSG